MEELIFFRSLAAKLTLEEYHLFIQKLIAQNSIKEILFKLLFNYFHENLIKSNQSNKNELNVNDINQIMSNIIQNRQSNKDKDDKKVENDDNNDNDDILTMDQLPSSLNQEIASYLPLLSYSNLESCNRSIFIALRSNPSLYQMEQQDNEFWKFLINSDNINKISYVKKISKIKKLTIDGVDISSISLIHKYNLKYLKIEFVSLNFINQIHLFKNNWKTIQYLSLKCSQSTDTLLFEIFKHCTNIQYLELRSYCFESDAINSDQLFEIDHLHKLKGLSILENEIPVTYLRRMININLESFHFWDDGSQFWDSVFWDNSDIQFNKLKEIHLCDLTNQRIKSIIQKTKNVERIILDFVGWWSSVVDNRICALIKDIVQMNKLNYLCIHGLHERYLISLISGLQNALPSANKESFKIQLGGLHIDTIRNDIHLELIKLVNALNTWCLKDFMLIVCDNCQIKQAKLKTLSAKFDVELISNKDHQQFVISNKNNGFNSYHEQWIMKCHDCPDYIW